jgi:hypothetical protein
MDESRMLLEKKNHKIKKVDKKYGRISKNRDIRKTSFRIRLTKGIKNKKKICLKIIGQDNDSNNNC